jgi:hypothetical protein
LKLIFKNDNDALKKAKKYVRESELSAWNAMAGWKDFRPPYILKAVCVDYIQHVTSACFTPWSQFGTKNQHRRVHGSVTTHTGGSVSFVFLFCRLRFLDANQAWWNLLLKCMCEVMIAKNRFNSSWIAKLNTLWYVGFQPFFY